MPYIVILFYSQGYVSAMSSWDSDFRSSSFGTRSGIGNGARRGRGEGPLLGGGGDINDPLVSVDADLDLFWVGSLVESWAKSSKPWSWKSWQSLSFLLEFSEILSAAVAWVWPMFACWRPFSSDKKSFNHETNGWACDWSTSRKVPSFCQLTPSLTVNLVFPSWIVPMM